MKTKGSINKMEDVYSWFYNLSNGLKTYPFWTLWGGKGKVAAHVRVRNEELEDIDQSWERLRESIEIQNGGNLTLYVTDKKGSTNGYTVYINLSEESPSLAGLPQQQQYGLGAIPGGLSGYVADQIKTAKQEVTNEFKIQSLQAQLEAAQTPVSKGDRIIDACIDNLPTILAAISPGLAGIFGNVTGASQPPNALAGTQVAQEQSDEELQEAQQRIGSALHRIQSVEGFEDVPTILEKLAGFIETQPDMAKTFLN